MAKFERIAALLQIREGEGRIVGWLFAHAFFGGIPLTLTSAAGNALFLEHHGASMLPWVYLAAALVVPLVGWMCLRFEQTVSFDRFLVGVVGLVFAGQVASRASIFFLGAERATWGLPLWTELEYSLTSLELWALAGRLLNVQQAKRLLGVIGSGAPLAGGLAGLCSPLFVRFLGTPNLLVLSAVASLASLLVLRRICTREHDRIALHADDHHPEHDRHHHQKKKKEDLAKKKTAPQPKIEFIGDHAPAPQKPAVKKKREGLSAELRPYVRATYALMALAFVSYYFIERTFYDRAEARIPDTAALASFLGVFMGIVGLVSLIFRLWLSAQLLARWGLVVGLLTLPVLVVIGATWATTAGIVAGAGTAAVFWAVAMTRASNNVLHESLDMQAVFMLYQPLPRATRVAVQGMGEAIIGPLAGGIAGGLLILLDKLGVDVVRLTALTACIAVVWLFIANYLRRAYRMVLERALADRRLRKEDNVMLRESARGPLFRALDSTYAGEVLYALDMLEDIGWRTARGGGGGGGGGASVGGKRGKKGEPAAADLRPEAILKKLLKHPSTDVRREALNRIERGAIAELLPDVMVLADKESDDRIRARAFRVLAAITDDDDAERIWLDGNASTDPRVRREVMTGCLASGSIDRIAIAWHELRRLAESPDPAQRILAASVLRKVGSSTFHRPLLKLLGDHDRNVQRAALIACKTVRHPRLLPIVVRALRSRGLRAAAGTTLIAIGEPALPLLRELVHDVRDWRVRVRALRVAARLKGPLAERLALDLLDSAEEEVRHSALLALVACGHRPRSRNAASAALDHLVGSGSGSDGSDGSDGSGAGGAGGAALSTRPNPSFRPSLTPSISPSVTPFSQGARSTVGTTSSFERLLDTEVADAAWTLAALIDLEVVVKRLSLTGASPQSLTGTGAGPHSAVTSSKLSSQLLDQDGIALVVRALRRELGGCRDRILLLLSFLYDAQAMHAARASYSSPSADRRAIALELLDTALPKSVRSLVIPLFDDVSAKQALEDMPDEVVEDEVQQGRRGRLRDLVDPKRLNVTSWTRVCAIWALRDVESIRPLENSADEDVRETARYVIRNAAEASSGVSGGSGSDAARSVALATSETTRKGSAMLTVEKVLILRSVPMFERTPDHILSELAGILKEVDLESDVDFIKEGDIGDCLFVIVHGGVKVHRGGDLVAELGARDIVGEMSVLDPEPRSASVTTTKATRLLRIDRDDFFDLMADRIEIAQGILGVLCQRLRGLGSRSLSIVPPVSDL